MNLSSPNLDDRRFADLVKEARDRIQQTCPEWTDLSPGDPGMVLLEAFAYLTEVMIYRLNKVPEKAYIEFLGLIGVRLQPPAAAVTTLEFSIPKPLAHAIEIAKGTRVTLSRAGAGKEPPIFTTSESVTIAAGALSTPAVAYHCDWVRGEIAGKSTGLPGFSVSAKRPPIVAPNKDGLDLVLGVSANPEELENHTPALEHEGKTYIVWREVENFANLGTDRRVYVVDRLTGTVSFSPAVQMLAEQAATLESVKTLAEIPKLGREICLWYRRGGGSDGNLTAHTLTTLKDPIAGVVVTNPEPAVGGKAAETLENALIRGPQELHSLQRVVTARDYELLAVRCSGAANRAKAFTRSEIWLHAKPGTVEVLIVPNIVADVSTTQPVTSKQLEELTSEQARQHIQNAIGERRPMCTDCVVNWAHYKTVMIQAQIVAYREQDPQVLKDRLLRKLYRGVNPIAAPGVERPWPFGQSLRVFDVYKILGDDPGVKSVNNVRLMVDQAPDKDIKALCTDAFQARTWYAGNADCLFRSLNDGEGWELLQRFAGEKIDAVTAWSKEAGAGLKHAGLLAVTTSVTEAAATCRVRISPDCGETWLGYTQTNFQVENLAWIEREGIVALLLATEKGLFELTLPLDPEAGPKPVMVDAEDAEIPLYAIAVSADASGGVSVAVAAGKNHGIYLSNSGGRTGSYTSIGLKTELIRTLAVQTQGAYRYLWAGLGAPGTDPGKGCLRWRFTGNSENTEGWRAFQSGWQAGSCNAIAFLGDEVYAATQRLGVLNLNSNSATAAWKAPDASCGLPIRDVGRFQPVDRIAAAVNGKQWLFVGGKEGIFRTANHGVDYGKCSRNTFTDTVTIPRNWLLCSGEHSLEITGEDEARID